MKLTPEFKAIALQLIRDLSDHQSNSGCNDFYLAEFMPDVEQRRAFIKKCYEENGDPEEFDEHEAQSHEYTSDMFMTMMLRKFIKELPIDKYPINGPI